MKSEDPQDAQNFTYASSEEATAYSQLQELMKTSPLPQRELHANLGLFLNRASLARILFMHDLYLKALNTHGVIMEFGVRWGQNMALFTQMRHIYEPYNMSRKVVGFDTFEGFPSVAPQDGDFDALKVGALNVTPNYEKVLTEILSAQEKLAPRSHIRKFELVKGDVNETLPLYLERHPETIIALAYFDLDLYEPTKKSLEAIRPYLAKNSIVGFDELVLAENPGETLALREAWGTEGYRICRSTISPQQSYVVFE
jgi:hypothetical protein